MHHLTASQAPLDNLSNNVATLQADGKAASLHQRAWLLQLIALELHFADAAIPQHRHSISTLLEALFIPPDCPGQPSLKPVSGVAELGVSFLSLGPC